MPRRRLTVIVTFALGAVVSACGDGSDEGFTSARACRNVERLIAAVDGGDESATGDELDRLTDDDEVVDRIDEDRLEDAVDNADSDEIEDAVTGLDCDIEVETPSDPTSPPSDSTSPTEPDPTGPTTGSTTDFTLPPPPTVPAKTEPTTPTPTGSTPATTATTTTSATDPPPARELITVEVEALEGEELGPHDERTFDELAAEFDLVGWMIPAGETVVESVYISHTLGSTPNRYEETTFLFASELGSKAVLGRFREAVRQQGAYTFTETQSSDALEFRATQENYEGTLPNWTVRVEPPEGGVHRVAINRADYTSNVRNELVPSVAARFEVQLGHLERLGWGINGYTHYASVSYRSNQVSFDPGEVSLDDAARALLRELGPDARIGSEDAELVTVEVAGDEGTWSVSDFGSGASGTYSDT